MQIMMMMMKKCHCYPVVWMNTGKAVGVKEKERATESENELFRKWYG
jgi:hypothetical protein